MQVYSSTSRDSLLVAVLDVVQMEVSRKYLAKLNSWMQDSEFICNLILTFRGSVL